jgi:hypothetical protein
MFFTAAEVFFAPTAGLEPEVPPTILELKVPAALYGPDAPSVPHAIDAAATV